MIEIINFNETLFKLNPKVGEFYSAIVLGFQGNEDDGGRIIVLITDGEPPYNAIFACDRKCDTMNVYNPKKLTIEEAGNFLLREIQHFKKRYQLAGSKEYVALKNLYRDVESLYDKYFI